MCNHKFNANRFCVYCGHDAAPRRHSCPSRAADAERIAEVRKLDDEIAALTRRRSECYAKMSVAAKAQFP